MIITISLYFYILLTSAFNCFSLISSSDKTGAAATQNLLICHRRSHKWRHRMADGMDSEPSSRCTVTRSLHLSLDRGDLVRCNIHCVLRCKSTNERRTALRLMWGPRSPILTLFRCNRKRRERGPVRPTRNIVRSQLPGGEGARGREIYIVSLDQIRMLWNSRGNRQNIESIKHLFRLK